MRPLREALEGLVAAVGGAWQSSFSVPEPRDIELRPCDGAVTFWGHACVYIDVGGFGIVTDPVFERHYSPIHRRRIPSPPPSAYQRTRVILISHAHHDHLQPRTLARFPRRSVILCPPPSQRYVRYLGPRVRVMRPGDAVSFPGGTIIAVPADHPGGRYSRVAESDGRALGYVIQMNELTLYYSGDTAYFPGLHEIGARYAPDLALLNVNAHLRPAEAVQALDALGSPRVIPLHVGAYGGTAARRGRRWHREFRALAGTKAIALRAGDALPLTRAPAAPWVRRRSGWLAAHRGI